MTQTVPWKHLMYLLQSAGSGSIRSPISRVQLVGAGSGGHCGVVVSGAAGVVPVGCGDSGVV